MTNGDSSTQGPAGTDSGATPDGDAGGQHRRNASGVLANLRFSPLLLVGVVVLLVVAASVATGIMLGMGGSSNSKHEASGDRSPVASTGQPSNHSAVTVPTTAPTSVASSPAAKQRSDKTTSTTASKAAADKKSSKPQHITYTVKHGDTLTGIAEWFHMHGYGHIYDLNKKKIGKDPSLIYAGTKITISSNGMSVKTASNGN